MILVKLGLAGTADEISMAWIERLLLKTFLLRRKHSESQPY
jgi:hypothetical protein